MQVVSMLEVLSTILKAAPSFNITPVAQMSLSETIACHAWLMLVLHHTNPASGDVQRASLRG